TLSNTPGLSGLSYLSQRTAVQFLQFTSAATGVCVAAAMIRGFVANSKDMGNFFTDFVRSLTRLFLPLCFIAALIFVGLGVPQTLSGYQIVSTVVGSTQTILVGPVASLVSIMQLGTNGGGYYGANSAYPFQNPNPASDIFQIFLMLLIPTALCFVYGRMLGKRREARPILWGAYSLFAIDLLLAFIPNYGLGRGMEVRFGGFFSTFWTVVTTAVTTGSTGFTQIFYEFTSAAANNGSDFLGATGNTPFFNISTALVMLSGRFIPIGLLLALAGSMMNRRRTSEIGLRTDSATFTIVLVGSILLLVVLTFFPFLALGPILEFFQKRVNGF